MKSILFHQYNSYKSLSKELEMKAANDGYDLRAATIINNPNGQLLQRIYTAGYDSLIENVLDVYPDIAKYKIDYYYAFIVHGIVGMIETWLLRNQEEDVEEIIELLTEYTLMHLQYFVE